MNYVDITQQPQSIISLCPGIRGLERGLERVIADLNTLAFVEIEAFIAQNLVWAMEAGLVAPAPVWSDVKTFDVLPFRGKIHGIIGGYPCQPFSNAGNRLGTADPRHLYPFISQIIRAGQPLWCLFENVAGHLTMGYDTVRADLQSLGYNVEEGIYTAEEVGAPHQRERLFFLAIKRGYKLAYPNSIGHLHKQSEKQPTKGWKYAQCILSSGSGDVAHAKSIRVQGMWPVGQQEPQAHVREGLSMRSCGADRWPARRGEEQYEWEEPRTIKPGMGCTINGYNFREDFLRALGNAVVEQTAGYAFLDLINKHIENSK